MHLTTVSTSLVRVLVEAIPMRAGQRLSATTRGGTARRRPCVRAVLNLCIGWLLMVPLSGIAVAEGAELNQAATMDPETVDAKALVAEAIDLMRGIDNSYAEMTMTYWLILQ